MECSIRDTARKMTATILVIDRARTYLDSIRAFYRLSHPQLLCSQMH